MTRTTRAPRLHAAALPFAALLAASLTSLASPAQAAAPWVDRRLTLPRHVFAFNLGLGVAHTPETLAPGLNTEFAVGLSRRVELGVRTGFRFSDEARGSNADVYGRMFDTETYGTGGDLVANPEVALRGQIVTGDVIEVGLDGRVMLPFSTGAGFLLGIPISLHIGRMARLDTGLYVPVLFYEQVTRSDVSIPVHLWLQASDSFWIGPMSGVVFENDGPNRNLDHGGGGGSFTSRVPFGLGLGYSATRALDFKAQLLFRDVRATPRDAWGFGVGIEARAE